LFSGWGMGETLSHFPGYSLDGGMGETLSHIPGYLWFFIQIKTSSRHLSARPKVDLSVLVDITGHLSHFR
jgi:hypothetical protein